MANQEKINQGLKAFCKITKVVKSCQTNEQLAAAKRMTQNFRTQFGCDVRYEPDPLTTVGVLKTYADLLDSYRKNRKKELLERDTRIRN